MNEKMNNDFLEKLIIKSMIEDKKILTLVCSSFVGEYFNDPIISYVFNYYQLHLKKYNKTAPKDSIINSFDNKKEIQDFFCEIDSINYNIQENYDHFLDETNRFLKEKAIKKAILESVDVIDESKNINIIRNKIEDALCKDLKIDLGLNYFEEIGPRLKKIFNTSDYRLPTYYPQFDEYINGGFPPFTLSVLVAKIHGGKCVNENTKITIKNKTTGFVECVQIKDFFQRFDDLCNKLKKKQKTKISNLGIIKKIYNVNNYEVLSDIGFINILHVIKTIKMRKYIVYFNSGIVIECADRHKFIKYNNSEIFCNNLNVGDLIISNNGLDEVSDIIKTNEFINMYDLSLSNHHLYYTNGILSHNSQIMANFAARQVLQGNNIVLLTLEMSENEFAQRFDSIYSCLDINRIYITDKHKSELVKRLKKVKNIKDRGSLFIKQFPTGSASVNDFRIYLRELRMRGIKINGIYVDYINLMQPAFKTGDNLYSTVKRISEELRALSFEFEVPVISVSQLNREGSFVGFDQVDFNYIAECLDLNTKVIKDGKYIKIIYLKVGDKIKGINGDVEVKNIWPKRYKKRYKIKTKSGKEIICSYEHNFPTDKGIKSLKTGLKIGDKLSTTIPKGIVAS